MLGDYPLFSHLVGQGFGGPLGGSRILLNKPRPHAETDLLELPPSDIVDVETAVHCAAA